MTASETWLRLVAAPAAWFLGAYLAGTIPFGWLIGKARGLDLREHGSRNIGATNCGRVCGWPCGILAFALDVAKGFLPVAAAAAWLPALALPEAGGAGREDPRAWLLVVGVALGPILGHVFPVWLGFKGGKAVATSLGVLLALPMLRLLAAGALAVWCLTVLATRYVSVASSAAAVAFLASYLYVHRATAWGGYLPVTGFVVLLVAMVLARHRSNYARLLRGTENRLWGGKKGGGAAGG